MISTKGRYALRVLADLAAQEPDKSIPLKEIAQRQGISKKYLEIILKPLVEKRLVTGTSGKGGGYRLLRKPQEYTVWEILQATEGSLAPVACLAEGAAPCERTKDCPTLKMWETYYAMTQEYFESVRLSDLLGTGHFQFGTEDF